MTESTIIYGDCAVVPVSWPDNCINLIVTSPPYADKRKSNYQTAPADKYVDWFMERANHFARILTEDGSMVVNIKEHVHKCERSTYVHDLIRALRADGWLWVEEYCWRKLNTMPGTWSTRFRDGWERCHHFTRSRKFKMNQQSVMVPASKRTKERAARLNPNDRIRRDSNTGAPFGIKFDRFEGRDMVNPDNVLEMATESHDRGHPAVFPKALPEFFIRLFTDPGDWVFDPFSGSGTTLLVARELNRRSVGTDNSSQYCLLARQRLGQIGVVL